MLKLIYTLLTSWRKKPRLKAEPETEKDYDGQILIRWNAQAELIMADTDIFQMSDESAELLAHVLYGLSNGSLDDLLGKSLILWAEDEEKEEYLSNVGLIYKFLAAAELDQSDVDDDDASDGNKLAVDPSQVFGFRGGLTE